ncbi:hypothetical protein ACH4E7_11030 [Kitasatospora sp. NPDC018058]|uniref:hypothetical protein n=1 Tax=Kitasatospora sp. NPDC018058 TaxID=3364025 RepID=UPI0037C068F9
MPGWVTVLMVLAELAGAVTAAWLLFPAWAAVLVSLLALACCGTELPRWRRLLAA